MFRSENLISLFMWLFPLFGMGATVISGTVEGRDGNLLADIGVTVLSRDSVIIDYTMTGEDGGFSLDFPSSDGVTHILRFSGLGYETKYIDVGPGSHSDPVTVSLDANEFEIDEVIVTAEECYQKGDTLNFNVGSYVSPVDRKIGDVLKRMPGITVGEDGKIEFNGRRISSVYVEGMDLTGSQYGQITQGINAADISTVQVLQNNQPVKMLQGVLPSEEVDINLKLRNDSKNVWTVNADASIGVLEKNVLTDRFSFGATISPMRFSKTSQTITSVRVSDNYLLDTEGSEIDSDIRPSFDYLSVKSMLQPPFGTIPNLEMYRQYGNKQNLLKTNWVWKTSEDRSMRLNLRATTERNLRLSTRRSVYTTIDRMPSQTLSQSDDAGKNSGYVNFEMVNNARTKFSRLNSESYIELSNADSNGELNEVAQNNFHDYHNITTNNAFTSSWIVGDNNMVNLGCTAAYTQLGNKLSVLNADESSRTMFRDAEVGVSSDFIIKLLGCRLSCNAGIDYEYKEFSTNMPVKSVFRDNTLSAVFKPGMNYMFNRFSIRVDMPISLLWRNATTGEGKAYGLFGISATSSYTLNNLWRISFTPSFSQKNYSWRDLIPFQFYSSFNTRRVGGGDYAISNSLGGTFTINYNDMIKGYSGYFMTTMFRSDKYPLVRVSLDDEVSVFATDGRQAPLSNILLKSQISKRFPAINAILSLTGQLNKSESSSLSGSDVLPQHIENGNVVIKFSSDVFSWMNLMVGGSMSYTRQKMGLSDGEISNRLNSYTADGEVSFMYGGFIGSLSTHIMKNSIPNSAPSSILDAKFAYKWSKYELSLTCENLMNDRYYSRRIITPEVTTTYTTYLRPRHIQASLAINF